MAKKKTTKKGTAKRKTTAKRTTKKTAPKKATTKKVEVKQSKGPADVQHRVYKLDRPLREAIKQKREQVSTTNRELIREAVTEQLPQLVEELAKLGVAVEDAESVGPARLPMEHPVLQALARASQWSGLDQQQLLTACLRLQTRSSKKGGSK